MLPQRTLEHDSPLLLCVAGLGGAIGTTLCVGLALAKKGLLEPLGMATESPLVRSLSPALTDLRHIVPYGWDLKTAPLFDLCQQLNIVPPLSLQTARDDLLTLRARPPSARTSCSLGTWIAEEARLIAEMGNSCGAQSGVLVNLCPTEPITLQPAEQGEPDWRDLASLSAQAPHVTPSCIYFRLAIAASLHFINFTPNVAETPGLRALAEEKSLLYCGRDGKTGQTFIKTVLAPAFRDKNLRVDGWYSTNLLGNDDGLTLANADCRKAKERSKLESLRHILGYQPGSSQDCHQVHIHYYPPRGDAKEAWDSIDFTGFLGAPMQMKLNWLGRDSLLAAPAVLDLVRLVRYAASHGRVGVLHEVSYFFKDPIAKAVHEEPVHSTPDQFQRLLDLLRNGQGRP